MTPSLLLLLATTGDAQAWYHTGQVWNRRDMPLNWWMADNPDDSIDNEYVPEAISAGWQTWVDDAPCAQLEVEYGGLRDDHGGGFDSDALVTFSMDDPRDQLKGSTLAATLCIPSGEQAFSRGERSYFYSYDCDIVYNDHVDWGEWEDIENGQCNDEFSLQAVSTHEIGHLWGMGHSCDDPADDDEDSKPQGVSCDDPELSGATMFWSTGPCNNGQGGGLTTDDVEGMYALYGPYCSFEATTESDRFGGAPMEVCFEVECNEPPDSFEWNFGDGQTDTTTLNTCHTYETKGQFSVSLTTQGSGDECGEWENRFRERAYVLVCSEPEPAEGFGGLFTYEHFDGLQYQMINQTDTSVYGCVDRIQWDVFKGGELIQSISAWSPKIEFPEEGEYRVVLNVGGPGGTSAAEINITAEDLKGERSGCSVTGGAAGVVGALVGLAAVARRRRD